MTTNIRPLYDRVIVRRDEVEKVSDGGIVIPDRATEKPLQGEVIAIGSGKVMEDGRIRPLDVKPGDKILFTKYGDKEVKIDGEDLIVLREADIIGIITD